MSSQMELEEAFRLACQHRDEGLTIHGQWQLAGWGGPTAVRGGGSPVSFPDGLGD